MKKNFPALDVRTALAAFALATFLSSAATAAPLAERTYARVDSVQMPAWVERNGVRKPLAPGATLQNRDRVTTGADARVRIALADGSAVKLGENAELNLNALGRRDNRVFTAALDLSRGALRLTTAKTAKAKQARMINVRVATITAGVRGTDLVGQASAERDLVCLVDGRIVVMHAQDTPHAMTEPMSLYAAAKDGAPTTIDHIDPAQLNLFATQTDIPSGSGYARRGGKWKVELAEVASQEEALALYDKANAAGYAVSILPKAAAESGSGYSYSLRVAQLPSQAEAAALKRKVSVALDLAAVVTRD